MYKKTTTWPAVIMKISLGIRYEREKFSFLRAPRKTYFLYAMFTEKARNTILYQISKLQLDIVKMVRNKCLISIPVTLDLR